MIEVEKISKQFVMSRALEGVEFTVAKGEVCGLIGSNGAGKTTLLRILATVLRPSSGTARVAGFDVRTQAEEVRRRIGYMPDVFGAYEELLVSSYLAFFAHVYGLPEEESWRTIDDILRLVDLAHLRNSPIARLSLGARQRLALGRVLLHNPEVLLLDEPVSGLDPATRVEMRELLKELGRMGRTVLISSHVLADLADLCHRLVIIEKGERVFAGTLDELRRRVMPDRVLEIGIEGDLEPLREFIARQPWAKEGKPSDCGTFRVSLADGSLSPAVVSTALCAAGFRITRLLEREMNLEEAFLRITRGAAP